MSATSIVTGAMGSLYWTVDSAGVASPVGASLTGAAVMVTVAGFGLRLPIGHGVGERIRPVHVRRGRVGELRGAARQRPMRGWGADRVGQVRAVRGAGPATRPRRVCPPLWRRTGQVPIGGSFTGATWDSTPSTVTVIGSSPPRCVTVTAPSSGSDTSARTRWDRHHRRSGTVDLDHDRPAGDHLHNHRTTGDRDLATGGEGHVENGRTA